MSIMGTLRHDIESVERSPLLHKVMGVLKNDFHKAKIGIGRFGKFLQHEIKHLENHEDEALVKMSIPIAEKIERENSINTLSEGDVTRIIRNELEKFRFSDKMSHSISQPQFYPSAGKGIEIINFGGENLITLPEETSPYGGLLSQFEGYDKLSMPSGVPYHAFSKLKQRLGEVI